MSDNKSVSKIVKFCTQNGVCGILVLPDFNIGVRIPVADSFYKLRVKP